MNFFPCSGRVHLDSHEETRGRERERGGEMVSGNSFTTGLLYSTHFPHFIIAVLLLLLFFSVCLSYLDGVSIAVAVLAQVGGSQSETCLNGFWLAREIAQVDQCLGEKILST